MENLVIDAILAIESNSKWNEQNFSKEVIDKMSLEDLRDYAFRIFCRFTNLGYELSRVSEVYKILSKY